MLKEQEKTNRKAKPLIDIPDITDILDAMPFYVLLVDADHNIIEANSAVHTHLGVERKDILGKYCPKVVHGLDEPFHGCPLEEAARKNRAIERELYDENIGKWLVSAIYPTRALTREGKKVFLHMVTDITERKQAQEQCLTSRAQLRLLSAHLESVREEEKKKIARDLHDETSQVLSSLHAHLEAAIATLPPGAEKSRDLLKKTQELSVSILDELHKLIYELRPAALDELGLTAAINSMLNNSKKLTGIKIKFQSLGIERRMPADMEIMLFRVIQEAFNNIVKHAQARSANLLIHYKKNSVKIRIKDNGIGFDLEQIKSNGSTTGLGLIGIRERVEIVNGTLSINSNPGKGTEIIIEVPLNGGANDG